MRYLSLDRTSASSSLKSGLMSHHQGAETFRLLGYFIRVSRKRENFVLVLKYKTRELSKTKFTGRESQNLRIKRVLKLQYMGLIQK